MIENNDEAKRSKIWTVVTSVTSVLIIIVAIFLLMKMFTGNPLEGSWTDEDGNMNLKISRDGQMTVTIPASGEGKDTEVPMTYTMNKESKTISIQQDDAQIQKIAEKSDVYFWRAPPASVGINSARTAMRLNEIHPYNVIWR